MHDPRAYHSMGLVYATAPRGADHNKSDAYMIDGGSGHPELDVPIIDRWDNDKAATVEKSQNFRAVTDSLGICHFAHIPFSFLIEMINASTGWNMDIPGLFTTGERIFQLQRMLSCKLGISAKDDQLPELALRPIPDGGQEGHVPDIERMLAEYYALREWNKITGKPSKARLEKLGMKEISSGM
jgi:aldehyde:ferredoxin oxidoreductase